MNLDNIPIKTYPIPLPWSSILVEGCCRQYSRAKTCNSLLSSPVLARFSSSNSTILIGSVVKKSNSDATGWMGASFYTHRRGANNVCRSGQNGRRHPYACQKPRNYELGRCNLLNSPLGRHIPEKFRKELSQALLACIEWKQVQREYACKDFMRKWRFHVQTQPGFPSNAQPTLKPDRAIVSLGAPKPQQETSLDTQRSPSSAEPEEV
ncbi:hypothetical protein BJ508DRAFT_141152 [Ascobolus immersus RN42]|uniref:Uncharacterized protein n=1 Tax=Ascobolus immersus RN42 TaxID=1160509 RepID=A0A3N4I1Z6_ASCIM|nr:hypothetical protein BJ508DRAFT_141152 [Ascobolus immersus RN42]